MYEDSRLKEKGSFRLSFLLILLPGISSLLEGTSFFKTSVYVLVFSILVIGFFSLLSVTIQYQSALAIINTVIGNDTGGSNATSVTEPVTGASGNILITINPGSFDSSSQNPISAQDLDSKSPLNPSQLVVPVGGNVTWFNNDPGNPGSWPHHVYSGDPEKGPSNIFYQGLLGYGKNFTFTFDKPGIIPWYDYDHIVGKITVVE